MRTTRSFMRRSVRHLAERYGVRQFLDIGTGIPTSPNVHEIAQAVHPDARVAYVDNDPIVLTHARALMSGTSLGRTCYVDADFRDPESIIGDPRLREVLDLSEPVALSLVAIVHFVLDEDDPQGIVRRFMDALAPGSFLVLTVFTGDTDPVGVGGVGREYNARGIPL
jgi:SAM-dependent methyltransferase